MSDACNIEKSEFYRIGTKNKLTSSGNEHVKSDAQSERSTTALLSGSNETVGTKAKALWKKLKEEDAERKQSNIQHVTHQEATTITGHGENVPGAGTKHGKGDKRIATTALFC
jgi:hypothetical protein